jgi:hypothetical protein
MAEAYIDGQGRFRWVRYEKLAFAEPDDDPDDERDDDEEGEDE